MSTSSSPPYSSTNALIAGFYGAPQRVIITRASTPDETLRGKDKNRVPLLVVLKRFKCCRNKDFSLEYEGLNQK